MSATHLVYSGSPSALTAAPGFRQGKWTYHIGISGLSDLGTVGPHEEASGSEKSTDINSGSYDLRSGLDRHS